MLGFIQVDFVMWYPAALTHLFKVKKKQLIHLPHLFFFQKMIWITFNHYSEGFQQQL